MGLGEVFKNEDKPLSGKFACEGANEIERRLETEAPSQRKCFVIYDREHLKVFKIRMQKNRVLKERGIMRKEVGSFPFL